MSRFTRRAALAAVTAIALSACGQAGGEDTGTTGNTGSTGTNVATEDVIKGDANAPVTMIEYASWTCPACLQFDQQVMTTVQSDYIDTGKVRFVFREFPTPPQEVAVAGFAIARCAGPEKYNAVVDELFERQPGILSLVRNGGQVKEALMQVAENNGIKGEEAFDACLSNPEVRRAISTSIQRADAKGVNSTPTVFVNGEKLEGFEWRTPEGMSAILDEALGITPEAAPAE